MPVEAIWKSKGYVIARYSGVVTFQETQDFILGLASDPRWQEVKYNLSDWTRVEALNFNEAELREFSVHLSVHNRTLNGFRIAMVLGSYENAGVAAKIFVDLMAQQDIEVRVLPTIEQAEAWLFGQ